MAIPDPAWLFPPNWDSGVLELLEWRTDVLESTETGEEQRISRRLWPRRYFEGTFLVNKRDRQTLDVLLSTQRNTRFYMPMWHQVSQLQADADAGDTVLQINTAFSEYDRYNILVIRGPDAMTYEIIGIDSITSSTITIDTPLVSAWPRGAFVYPGFVGQLTDRTEASKKSDQLYELTARFMVYDVNRHPRIADGFFEQEYNETPVFLQPPDDSEDLNFSYQQRLETIDNGAALPYVLNPSLRTFYSAGYRWSFKGREAAYEVKRLLFYLRGRARAIWLPTFMNDFTLTGNITSGGVSIPVKNVGYTIRNAISQDRSVILIHLWNGTKLLKTVISSTEVDADTETLTVAAGEAFSQTITPLEVRNISYVSIARLEQDSVEIQHVADADGLTKIAVIWKYPSQAALTGTYLGGGAPNYWDYELGGE